LEAERLRPKIHPQPKHSSALLAQSTPLKPPAPNPPPSPHDPQRSQWFNEEVAVEERMLHIGRMISQQANYPTFITLQVGWFSSVAA